MLRENALSRRGYARETGALHQLARSARAGNRLSAGATEREKIVVLGLVQKPPGEISQEAEDRSGRVEEAINGHRGRRDQR